MTTLCTLYKGLITLVIAFIIMQYLFGSIEYKSWESVFYNNASSYLRPSTLDTSSSTTGTNRTSPLIGAILPNTNNNPMTEKPSPSITNRTANRTYDNLVRMLLQNGVVNRQENPLMETTQSPDEDLITTMTTCPETPPNLAGNLKVIKSDPASIMELEKRFDWLLPGGHWRPVTCRVTKKVAVIVPYRCRAEHLLLFLQHMHPFLKKQQIDYRIVVVEQDDDGPFNRAMLMNIGYVESLKLTNFDCFIFHDVDLLPEDERNLYTCPIMPRHMSVAVDVFQYSLPYRDIFGGVSAISRDHFLLLNGFSNSFWGWGGEDDDMSNRIRYHNLIISRYPKSIARYTMLTHKKEKANPHRYEALKRGKLKFRTDGLNSLRYTVSNFKENVLYTWFLVNIKPNR